MNCKNCDKEMKRIMRGAYHCEHCNNIFKIDGDKQTPVEDKKKFFDEVIEMYEKVSAELKEIMGKYVKPTKKTRTELEEEEGLFL